MNYDAIIIGAGPVGSTVAEAIARERFKVLILEEHAQIGLPQHCTGKISVNASQELQLPKTHILQQLRGATFYSPDMNLLTVERKDAQAYIYDRQQLDQWLSEKAVDAGATLLVEARATEISLTSQGAKITFKHHDEICQATSRIVVGADGASSSVAHHLGLYSKSKPTIKVAIQRELTGLHDLHSEFAEIYLGRKYAPGFFAWIVPISLNSVRVGLCTSPAHSKHLLDYLDNFITSHPIACQKLAGGKCVRQTAHLIPTGGTLPQTVSDGTLIVGDAAGHVKSTTGGGLYYGMSCAKIAGQVISTALSGTQGLIQKDTLLEYSNIWYKKFGKEIVRSVKMRLLLDSLTDDEVNYLFQMIRTDEHLLHLIESEGDIDWQSNLSMTLYKNLIVKLVKKPQLLLKLGKFIVS